MPTELPKVYDPKEAQQKWLPYWEQKGYFHADPNHAGESYTIVIPPPNVTGALHMGHALNNTLQDVLIRWRRMQGRNTLWMPGTDHAGIATQAVVERLIMNTEKKTRHDLGRDALVAKIWEWKDKYEKRILGQLREMGASCDWQRTRFTLDATCARAVRETFFRMFRDGYIYRGKRLVNWDTQLQTSVADDETYTETTKGGFWTFQYAVIGLPDTYIQFSTTRPETMLGDTALCVHPDDERYKSLVGKKVLQPHTGREIPIIADGLLADPELGTGCVKVTPAHDPNDYACWQRNPQIKIINILNPDGTILDGFGEYSGLDRAKAREAVAKKMEELGLYIDKQDRDIPLPYSDRSKTPIEPFLSDQWFVKMTDRDDGKSGLAQIAMDAVTSGKVKFFPERYAKTYLDWLGEKRDWCISRQLWWGHRIPVWTLHVDRDGIFGSDIISKSTLLVKKTIAALSEFILHCGFTSDMFEIRESVDFTLHISCANPELGKTLDQLSLMIRHSRLRTLQESDDEGPVRLPDRAKGNFPPEILELADRQKDMPISQESDVLDTWFSSALWPHSTMGWPEQTAELKKYYPTSTLVTSRDIISLWVARMVITGLYNCHEVPFHHVYIHPQLQDAFGNRMSKTTGNGIDPLDIIERYGADSLRYQMLSTAGDTQDSRLAVSNVCPHCDTLVPTKQEHLSGRTKKLACPSCKKLFRPGGPWTSDDPELPTAKQASDRFEVGRNFANKLWNATRFILMNLEGYTPAPVDVAQLAIEDRWILSRLATTTDAITSALENYQFADVAKLIYEYAWTEFCDWYIEMSKARRSDPTCQRVLVGVLDGIVRLIQPIMPFLAETLWHALNEAAPQRGLPAPQECEESVCIAKWPVYPEAMKDSGTESGIARMQDMIRGVRELRSRYQIEKEPLQLAVRCSGAIAEELLPLTPFLMSLGGLTSIHCGPETEKPKQAGSIIRAEYEAYIPLEGLIDPASEVKRLEKQIADIQKQLVGMTAKMNNESYIKNAPAEVVQETRIKIQELQSQIEILQENLIEMRES